MPKDMELRRRSPQWYKVGHFPLFPGAKKKESLVTLVDLSFLASSNLTVIMVYNKAILALALAGSALAAPVPQLLNDLSPDVATLVTGLGLGTLAPGLAGTLDTLGTDVKVKRQLLDDLSPDVAALVTGLGLGTLAPGLAGTLDTLGTDVKPRQLLDDLSPDVATLVTGLGLGTLAPGLAGTLDTLGTDV